MDGGLVMMRPAAGVAPLAPRPATPRPVRGAQFPERRGDTGRQLAPRARGLAKGEYVRIVRAPVAIMTVLLLTLGLARGRSVARPRRHPDRAPRSRESVGLPTPAEVGHLRVHGDEPGGIRCGERRGGGLSALRWSSSAATPATTQCSTRVRGWLYTCTKTLIQTTTNATARAQDRAGVPTTATASAGRHGAGRHDRQGRRPLAAVRWGTGRRTRTPSRTPVAPPWRVSWSWTTRAPGCVHRRGDNGNNILDWRGVDVFVHEDRHHDHGQYRDHHGH